MTAPVVDLMQGLYKCARSNNILTAHVCKNFPTMADTFRVKVGTHIQILCKLLQLIFCDQGLATIFSYIVHFYQWRTQKIFMGGFIQWHMVVICLWCSVFVTS